MVYIKIPCLGCGDSEVSIAVEVEKIGNESSERRIIIFHMTGNSYRCPKCGAEVIPFPGKLHFRFSKKEPVIVDGERSVFEV